MPTSSTTDTLAVHRRTVRTMTVAQVFSAMGNGSTLALGSILAVDLSGRESLAGTTTTALTLAPALLAVPLSGIAVRHGRRFALASGLVVATAGTAAIVGATVWRSFALLILGAFLVGVGSAVNLQARFAATDLAPPERRGRDLSLVVWAVTIGAVLGPNTVRPGAVLAGWVGLPANAGAFLFSAAGMLVAALILWFGLRPDPLLLRQRLDAASGPVGEVGTSATAAGGVPGRPTADGVLRGPGAPPRPSVAEGWAAVRASRPATAALVMIITAHAVMVAVMSVTPLHLERIAGHGAGHPDTLTLVGLTISLHVAGMFALSPVMGWAADRVGAATVAVGGLGVLLVSVAVAGGGHASVPAVTVGLVLLGLGWSAATVAGSALLVESLPATRRVPAQGLSDALMSGAGALGSLGAGGLLGLVGYGWLNAASGALVVLVVTGVLAARPGARADAGVPTG